MQVGPDEIVTARGGLLVVDEAYAEFASWSALELVGDATPLVVVRTYTNKFEADVAKSALDAAKIDSLIRADDAGGTRPHLWMGGVELLVRAEDAASANEILGA